MAPSLSIAIIGAGKIASDQHIPSIDGSDRFTLRAIVDPARPDFGVPVFESLSDLLASGIAVDAVAICTPPQIRARLALDAIAAGLHVLLEKPPAATLGEAAAIQAAKRPDRTIFTTWHSRHAPMVDRAREWLSHKIIKRGRIIWREDAHRWHPGQEWLWRSGGLGVFDPAINAFSILTSLAQAPLTVASANFQVPSGLDAPISAQLSLHLGEAPISADLHFHDGDTPEWTIELETDGGMLRLLDGGAALAIDGDAARGGGNAEYPAVYARFANLIDHGASEMDVRPLQLVADAFLLANREAVDAFTP